MSDDFLAELQRTFFEEAESLLEELETSLLALDRGEVSTELLNKLFRLAHNFKGSSMSVGLTALGRLAHRAEDQLALLKSGEVEPHPQIVTALLQAVDTLKKESERCRADIKHQPEVDQAIAALTATMESEKGASAPVAEASGFGIFQDEPLPAPRAAPVLTMAPTARTEPFAAKTPTQGAAAPADNAIRVATSRLDQLLNFVGELVVNAAIIAEHRSRGTTGSDDALHILDYTSKIVADIQDIALSLRMVPVRPLFQKLRRASRDVAQQLQKSIDLDVQGEDVELDKTVLDLIADPLTHMVRNAVDHGVESAEERRAAGKSAMARVEISAAQRDDRMVIIVADDGRGLDRERIMRKAIEKKLVPPVSNLSDSEVYALIFHPGFSTKEQVSSVSGRGVGMEVVQRAVEDLKGSIHIESTLGRGTRFTITLPLSLSIIGGMIVTLASNRYVLPMSQLSETIELSKLEIQNSISGSFIDLRGEVIPVFSLRQLLRIDQAKKNESQLASKRPAVISTHLGRKYLFEVDEIIGQQKIVLKPLGSEMAGLLGLLGGAILSDGEPGIVLSLHDLIQNGRDHRAA